MLACRWFIAPLFLLAASSLSLFAQGAAQNYREAALNFRAHTQGDFLHDDSKDGIEALSRMWNASAQAVVQVLSSKPEASASDLNAALCKLESNTSDCGEKDEARSSVVAIGPHLFLASQFSGEAGTVFLVGLREGEPALLWSINNTQPQKFDPQDLLGAWKAERAGGKCREEGSGHPPGTCGPLYADVGMLPSDSLGRPRFYIDAGYAQIMGATVGHQTSVWRWDGNSATLLWIDWYDFMIDQKVGTEFAKGVLTIGEKDDFRSFFGCGSCEARQMVRRLQITPTGIADLGKTSTTPELDLIDELFWRLANNKPAAEIASPEVSRLLRPQIASAREESKKIDPKWFSVGMLGDFSVKRNGDTKSVCFTADDIGRLFFTIQSNHSGKQRLVKVVQPSGNYGDCPK
jgi:hypothetical protein